MHKGFIRLVLLCPLNTVMFLTNSIKFKNYNSITTGKCKTVKPVKVIKDYPYCLCQSACSANQELTLGGGGGSYG